MFQLHVFYGIHTGINVYMFVKIMKRDSSMAKLQNYGYLPWVQSPIKFPLSVQFTNFFGKVLVYMIYFGHVLTSVFTNTIPNSF